MDKIDIADISDGDIFIVFHSPDDATYPGATMFYVYDADSAASEATPYVIYANDRSGSGAWILQSSFYFGGKASPAVNLLDSDQANQAIASFAADATDANDSVAQLKVEENTALTSYWELDGVNARLNASRDINLATGKTLMINTTDIVKEVIEILVFDDSEDVATGDGAGDVFFRIPAKLNGWYLNAVAAQVQTAGITGNLDIMIYNVSQTQDFLSTAMRIETTETDTSTSAQPGTINDSNDQVSTADSIRIDIDAVQSGTAPKGLIVELTFSPID